MEQLLNTNNDKQLEKNADSDAGNNNQNLHTNQYVHPHDGIDSKDLPFENSRNEEEKVESD